MGLFVYTQKGSIISMVDLPTTEIIEPFKECLLFLNKILQILLVKGPFPCYNKQA